MRTKAASFFWSAVKNLTMVPYLSQSDLPEGVLNNLMAALKEDKDVRDCSFIGPSTPTESLKANTSYRIACELNSGVAMGKKKPPDVDQFECTSNRHFYLFAYKSEEGIDYPKCRRNIKVSYYIPPNDHVDDTKIMKQLGTQGGNQLQNITQALFRGSRHAPKGMNVAPELAMVAFAFCNLNRETHDVDVFADIVETMNSSRKSYSLSIGEDGYITCMKHAVYLESHIKIAIIGGRYYWRSLYLHVEFLHWLVDICQKKFIPT
eukprot:GHVS01000944.1.p1 GENE.GHVS01000944.1~~GHVS01000944.1.p1  ORF type:complete len:263 (+),score=15.80 GHVS01000944.1:81-869(+)